jgi:hypothetical protein
MNLGEYNNAQICFNKVLEYDNSTEMLRDIE